MGSNPPEILEISSDEEDSGWEDRSKKGVDGEGEEGYDGDDWISELLCKDGVEGEESDEVVVISEVKAVGCKNKRLVDNGGVDGDDDECLILDGDPDKPVEVANEDGNGSDDLLVVREKGQIACRDYPHSRHMCAKFPFSTTHHATCCDQCHCYVCDAPAPCIYWGNGASNGDHCHSTDEASVWREQRKYFKQGNLLQQPGQKLPRTFSSQPSPVVSQSDQAPSLPQPLQGSNVPLYAHRSNPLRACSSTNSSSFPRPTIISARSRNNQQPGLVVGRNRLPQVRPLQQQLASTNGQPHQVMRQGQQQLPSSNSLPHHITRQQMLPSSNGATQNVITRGRSGGSLGPHIVPPHGNFKRVGPSRVATLGKNQPGHGYLYDMKNHMPQPQSRHYTSATSYGDIHNKGGDGYIGGINTEPNACLSASQPNLGSSGFVDSQSYNVSLRPPVYSQPVPPTIEKYQNAYPYVNSNFPNAQILNTSNFDSNWLMDTTQNLPQTADSGMQQPSSVQSTVMSIPQGPSAIDPAPPPGNDLNSWIEFLEHTEPDLGTAKDSATSVMGFSSHQEDLVNEAMLLFDFESS